LLDLLPVAQDGVRVCNLRAGKDVWMPADELFVQVGSDVLNGEVAGF